MKKQSYAHVSPILIAYYNITGSRGRSGAAEKLVKEERLSSFHGSMLVDWVGF